MRSFDFFPDNYESNKQNNHHRTHPQQYNHRTQFSGLQRHFTHQSNNLPASKEPSPHGNLNKRPWHSTENSFRKKLEPPEFKFFNKQSKKKFSEHDIELYQIQKYLNVSVPWSKSVILANMEDGVWQAEEESDTYYVHSYTSSCRVVDSILCTCDCPAGKKSVKSICSHLGATLLHHPEIIDRLFMVNILRQHYNVSYPSIKQLASVIYRYFREKYDFPLKTNQAKTLLEILCGYYSKINQEKKKTFVCSEDEEIRDINIEARTRIWDSLLEKVDLQNLSSISSKMHKLYAILTHMGPSCDTALYVMNILNLGANNKNMEALNKFPEIQKQFIDDRACRIELEPDSSITTSTANTQVPELISSETLPNIQVAEKIPTTKNEGLTNALPCIKSRLFMVSELTNFLISENLDPSIIMNLFTVPLYIRRNYDKVNRSVKSTKLMRRLRNIYETIIKEDKPNVKSLTQNEMCDLVLKEIQCGPMTCDLALWLNWPVKFQMLLGPFESFITTHQSAFADFEIIEIQLGVFIKVSKEKKLKSTNLLDIWNELVLSILDNQLYDFQKEIIDLGQNNDSFNSYTQFLSINPYIPYILRRKFTQILAEIYLQAQQYHKTKINITPSREYVENIESSITSSQKKIDEVPININCENYKELNNEENPSSLSLLEEIRQKEFGNMSITESSRLSRAVKQLSSNIYSNSCHVLMELLQNADDNTYSVDVRPTIAFIFTDTGLVTINNEKGFSEADVRAITDIGNSSKKNKKNKTGKFGVGFKSVFNITDTPYIFSNSYQFRFDSKKQYCYPITLEKTGWQSYCPQITQLCLESLAICPSTVFWFPYKSPTSKETSYKISCTLVNSLPFEALLFSRKLKDVLLVDAVSQYNNFSIARINVESTPLVSRLTLNFTPPDLVNTLNIATIQIRVNDTNNSIFKALTENSLTYIVGDLTENFTLAFPVNLQNLNAICKSCYVYCFVPIRKYGFHFIINSSSFNVTISREDIIENHDESKPVDPLLISNFAILLNFFCTYVSPTFFQFLPRSTDIIQSTFLQNLAEGFFNEVFTTAQIPSIIGTSMHLNQICLAVNLEQNLIYNLCQKIDSSCYQISNCTIKYLICPKFLESCGQHTCCDRLNLKVMDLVDVHDRFIQIIRNSQSINIEDLRYLYSSCLILFSIFFDKSNSDHQYLIQQLSELEVFSIYGKKEFYNLKRENLVYILSTIEQEIVIDEIENFNRIQLHLNNVINHEECSGLLIQYFLNILRHFSIPILTNSASVSEQIYFPLLKKTKDFDTIRKITSYLSKHSVILENDYFPVIVTNGETVIKNLFDTCYLINIKDSKIINKILVLLDKDACLKNLVVYFQSLLNPLSMDYYDPNEVKEQWLNKYFKNQLIEPFKITYNITASKGTGSKIANLQLYYPHGNKENLIVMPHYIETSLKVIDRSLIRFKDLITEETFDFMVEDYICLPLLLLTEFSYLIDRYSIQDIICELESLKDKDLYVNAQIIKGSNHSFVQSYFEYQKYYGKWLPDICGNFIAPSLAVYPQEHLINSLNPQENFSGSMYIPFISKDLFNWIINDFRKLTNIPTSKKALNRITKLLHINKNIDLNILLKIIINSTSRDLYLNRIYMIPEICNSKELSSASLDLLINTKWILFDDTSFKFTSCNNIYINYQEDTHLFNCWSFDKILTQWDVDIEKKKKLLDFCKIQLKLNEFPTKEMRLNDLKYQTKEMSLDMVYYRLHNIYSIFQYNDLSMRRTMDLNNFSSKTFSEITRLYLNIENITNEIISQESYKIFPVLTYKSNSILVDWLSIKKIQQRKLYLCSTELSLELFKVLYDELISYKALYCIYIPDLVDIKVSHWFYELFKILNIKEFSTIFELSYPKEDVQYIDDLSILNDFSSKLLCSQILLNSILFTNTGQVYDYHYMKSKEFKLIIISDNLTVTYSIYGTNIQYSKKHLSCPVVHKNNIKITNSIFDNIFSVEQQHLDSWLDICTSTYKNNINMLINPQLKKIFSIIFKSLISLNITLFDTYNNNNGNGKEFFNYTAQSILQAHNINNIPMDKYQTVLNPDDSIKYVWNEEQNYEIIKENHSNKPCIEENQFLANKRIKHTIDKENDDLIKDNIKSSIQSFAEDYSEKEINLVSINNFLAEEVSVPNDCCKLYENLNNPDLNKSVGKQAEKFIANLLKAQMNSEKVTIDWVNKLNESKLPYDIVIQTLDEPDIYIEVKSSTSSDKSFFEISRNEWLYAQTHGDNYEIYRVFNMLKPNVRVLRIKNPYQQWRKQRVKMYFSF